MAAKSRPETANVDVDDGYDPFANRPEGPVLSSFATSMHLLKSAIGNGIFFLPNGFKRAGYMPALFCSAIIGVLCTYTVALLVHCAQLLCRRHHIPVMDLAKTVETSFRTGPEKLQKYGKHIAVFTNCMVCFVQFQACVIYILYVATLLQQIIEYSSGVALDVRIYILALFPLFCGPAFLPNLKYLVPFSVCGFIFVLVGIFVASYYLVTDLPESGNMRAFTHVLPVPLYCNLFLYALHNVTVIMPLENAMAKPQHLPAIIVVNMLFVVILSTMFGFLGYNKYLDSTCDSVIKNLPSEQSVAHWVKIITAVSVWSSFGLAYFVIIEVLWPMIKWRYEAYNYAEMLFRLTGIIATYTLAIAVPEMIPLLGFLAAFSMTTMMLFIPILTETMTKWQYANNFLIAKNICIGIIWATLLIFGSIESFLAILREYGGAGKIEGC